SDDDAPLSLEGDEDLDPISLETGDADAPATASKIQAFGAHAASGQQQQQFKRELNLTGAGATRVRVFHSKITVGALDHMAEMINNWVDSDQIEIKSVAQVVGVMEGKKPEPNLIVTVWY
ncbi:hypothetical protein LCGC14_3027690, partial [marine sediment metagenome]